MGAIGNYKIWLAQYSAAPTYNGRYDMWQYSSKGKISGIKGNVDLNYSYLGYQGNTDSSVNPMQICVYHIF